MIKICLTGAGYQGGYSLVKELKKLDDRFYFVGVDQNKNSAAQFYCDSFYTDFDQAQLLEKPQVILPASSSMIPLGIRGEAVIMASRPEVILTCLSKTKTYRALRNVIPLPQHINNLNGYVSKLDSGKGGRGIEYLDGSYRFIMEKLTGEEIDVDVLSMDGELLVAMCKTRERAYGGTLMEGQIVDRPDIINLIKRALRALPLSYLSVWQFIGGKLLEINPRIAGAIFYPEGWNMPYLALMLALNEAKPRDIKKYQNQIPVGRRIYRWMDQYEK